MAIKAKKDAGVVTITKDEYARLERESAAYRKIAAKLFELPFVDSIDAVVKDFKDTDLYSDEFLKDLESGLRASSYR